MNKEELLAELTTERFAGPVVRCRNSIREARFAVLRNEYRTSDEGPDTAAQAARRYELDQALKGNVDADT